MRRPIASVPQNRRYSSSRAAKRRIVARSAMAANAVGKFEIAPGPGQTRVRSQVNGQFFSLETAQLVKVTPVHNETLSPVDLYLPRRTGCSTRHRPAANPRTNDAHPAGRSLRTHWPGPFQSLGR